MHLDWLAIDTFLRCACLAHRTLALVVVPRNDLLDAAAAYPDYLAAVRAVFAFIDSDAEAFDLIDAVAATSALVFIHPMRVCQAPHDVGLVHRSLAAGTSLPCPRIAAYHMQHMPICAPRPGLPSAFALCACHIIAPCADAFCPPRDVLDCYTRVVGSMPPSKSEPGREAWWHPRSA